MVFFSEECFCGNEEPLAGSRLPESSCDHKCPANKSQPCGSYFAMNILETGVASKYFEISDLHIWCGNKFYFYLNC